MLYLTQKFKNLSNLNLIRNNISHLKNPQIFPKSLKFLDLSCNPLKCDCLTIDSIDRFNSTENRIIKIQNCKNNYSDVYSGDFMCSKEDRSKCQTKNYLKNGIVVIIGVLILVLSILSYYIVKHSKSRSRSKNYIYDAFIIVHENNYDILASILKKQKKKDGTNYAFTYELRDYDIGKKNSENLRYFLDRSRKIIVIISKHFLESDYYSHDLKKVIEDCNKSRYNSVI